jgi:hypothetical protein
LKPDAVLHRVAGKNPVCDCGGGVWQPGWPQAEASASERRLTRLISPNRCGVTASKHVAIKSTRIRLIASGRFRGVFIGEYFRFSFYAILAVNVKPNERPTLNVREIDHEQEQDYE